MHSASALHALHPLTPLIKVARRSARRSWVKWGVLWPAYWFWQGAVATGVWVVSPWAAGGYIGMCGRAACVLRVFCVYSACCACCAACSALLSPGPARPRQPPPLPGRAVLHRQAPAPSRRCAHAAKNLPKPYALFPSLHPARPPRPPARPTDLPRVRAPGIQRVPVAERWRGPHLPLPAAGALLLLVRPELSGCQLAALTGSRFAAYCHAAGLPDPKLLVCCSPRQQTGNSAACRGVGGQAARCCQGVMGA